MPLVQDVDAKLTLTRVATAPALIAEVAKASGRHLEVASSLRAEILMVSVQDARLGDVLARLAIAATAIWQPVEGGYRLVPDNAARGIEARTERARRLQAIIEAQKKKAADDAKAKKGGGTNVESFGPGAAGGFGGSGTVDAFLPMLDLSEIAAMESGDRIVFSTAPTAVQKSLNGSPNGIVADWIASHNKSAEGMAGTLSSMPEGLDGMMKGPLGDRMRRMSRRIDGVPAKVLVVASRGAMPFFGGAGLDLRLEVRAYAADGSVLIEESGTIGSGFLDTMAALGTKHTAASAEPTTPIVYSEEAKALAALSNIQGMMAGGTARVPRPTAALRALLLKPTQNDPLALVPGEGLVALAKARRKPLVACLPDAAYPSLAGGAPSTVEEVEKGFATGPMRLVPDTTFLVVKAAEPETARETRLDRNALATFVREAVDHESPTLDELSDFAARTPAPSRNPLSMSMLSIFAPSAMSSMSGVVSWDAHRLYAALSPSQRQGLADGAKLPFNTISQAGQTALAAMLYGASGGVTVERAGVSDEPDLFAMGLKMALGGGDRDARDEPTEVAPTGLPAGGFLQASVVSEPIIRPITPEGPSASSVSADELAMVRLMADTPMGAQMTDAMRLPDSGRLGTRTVWSFRGFVARGACVTATLNDDQTPKDGATVSLSNLPEDIQARVAQRTEKLKNSPLGQMLSIAASMKKGAPR